MAKIALSPVGRPASNAAVHSRVEVGCLSRRPRLLGRPTGRTFRQVIHFGAARFDGTDKLDVRARQRGLREVWVGEEATEVAASGRRAIQDRKAKQDAFERDAAFEYFSRMLPRELASQLAAGGKLDGIARAIAGAPGGRRSVEKTRRRVGELRKEFLRLRSKFDLK